MKKLILSLLSLGVLVTSGCVSVHREEPATTNTRTTTIDTPVTPAVSSSTTTTTY